MITPGDGRDKAGESGIARPVNVWLNRLVDWIYLSPHFDDIALSCAGLIWEQNQAGDSASIWTICAADPPPGELSSFAQSLHARWQTSDQAAARRLEDQASCHILGAEALYFDLPDCIYRPGGESGRFYYTSEEAIFGSLHPAEKPLAERLASQFQRSLPSVARLVCPLALGGHVDHRLTRQASELLEIPLYYYADYPYVLHLADPFASLQTEGWESLIFPVSPAGLAAWQESIAAHRSQISTFWLTLDDMRSAIRSYCESEGGVRLWKIGHNT
jgi:LmbE family N-acetylglucosaminyl deacetylase